MPVSRLARHWWVMALRGVCALAFGIIAVIRPFDAFSVLVIFYGAYMLVDGIFALGALLAGGANLKHWWALLLEGLCGIGIGVITFVAPGVTEYVLVVLIGVWALLTGIFEIVAAFRLRQHIAGEVWLAVSGVISVLFGLVVLARPGIGALLVATLIGFYAIMFGCTLLALAIRLRRWHQGTQRGSEPEA
jgi:uncharacterized membrane protein HdeD (DUF308 family)